MIPYLPRTVAIGDKLRLVPSVLDKQDNGNEHCQQPHALTGQVIYIHPKRRFATVRFPLTGYDGTGHQVDKGFSECWPIMPDERRLAHKDPEPLKTGPTRPIAEILREREWTGMSQGQIARELGVSQQSVSNAIRVLAKRGIEIRYTKGLTFVQAAQARKTVPLRKQRAIGEYRKSAGLTQQMLADKIHVSKAAIAHWEKGEHTANWELLETALPGVTAYAKRVAAVEGSGTR